MVFDVLKIRRLLESRVLPIQMPEPLVKMGVPRANVPDVALEVLDVDGVEADDGCEEADVCFGDCGGGEEVGGRGGGEEGFEAVEGGEELSYGLRVCLFGAETFLLARGIWKYFGDRE